VLSLNKIMQLKQKHLGIMSISQRKQIIQAQIRDNRTFIKWEGWLQLQQTMGLATITSVRVKWLFLKPTPTIRQY